MYPIIQILVQFLKEVYHVVDTSGVNELVRLIETYQVSEIEELQNFAKGLAKDVEAVKNSLIYRKISNGPQEAANGRIKAIHRRSGGRAGVLLLNAYAIMRNRKIKIHRL